MAGFGNNSNSSSPEKLIGKELFKYIKAKDSAFNIFNLNFFKNQMLKMSISNPQLQRELFRFVDVLPALKSSKQVSQYLFEYLTKSQPDFLINNALLNKSLDWTVRSSVTLLAKSFICGTTTDEALKQIAKLKKKNQDYTLDLLGELVLSEDEAKQHYQEYLNLLREIPNTNLSIKLSGLVPQVNALDYQGKKTILSEHLRNIYREAIKQDSFINVDTENYAWKDFTYEIIQEILMEPEFCHWSNAGIVLQAYLKESEKDLHAWIAWARKRGVPITIRLVKGAYWDYEFANAKQHNWDPPVFTEKYQSDINYEKLTGILFDNHKLLRPAIASHNIRSLAHAMSYAENHHIDKSAFEFQMLYGMMDSLKQYFADAGYKIRVYMPYGELIPGMSYLVRRLLENTANDSFLRQGMLEGRDIDELLEDPSCHHKERLVHRSLGEEGSFSEAGSDTMTYSNNPNLDFSQKVNRKQMQEALRTFEPKFQKIHNTIIQASIVDCNKAIESAEQAHLKWSQANPTLRSAVLKLTAKKLRKQRLYFNSLLVLEAHKPWLDSDAEVSEAIDFLEYYADQALDLQNNKLRSLPGEKNSNHYQAYGVAVIISPWNFPLAIMAGMTVAALVMGNAVIIKPSQQTPVIALEFLKLLNESIKELAKDYAQGLVNFLPGDGKTIGSYLVEHPKTRLIAFTGSNAVGMGIHDSASKARPIKQVIAEMGGKNAIIIDDSADLDEAILGVIHSAFGYAGQKCSAASRVIVLDSIYEQFTARLVAATKAINICDPRLETCSLPPVIDQAAYDKIKKYISLGKEDGAMLLGDLPVPQEGNFISPYIFADLDPQHPLVQEEIFGPVLVIQRAQDLDQALDLANNTVFGLTGAFYSRSPNNIEKISREFEVGNLYINRGSTGAIVSRQAFGGLKQSSIGFKAGGPNYLLQFCQEKTITENTMRRGFVAD